MRTLLALPILFALTGLAPANALAADEAKDKAAPGKNLVGTWKLLTAKYGGNEYKYPEGTTMLKHVTPSQFMWATYDADGKVTRAAGGAYTIAGETYGDP